MSSYLIGDGTFMEPILEKKEVKDFIDIPPRKVTKENVDEYWADLKAKKAG